jgi:hypothetical protein
MGATHEMALSSTVGISPMQRICTGGGLSDVNQSIKQPRLQEETNEILEGKEQKYE